MCRIVTDRCLRTALLALHAYSIGSLWGQTTESALEWRRIGSASMDLALPSAATGAVTRIWYNADGSTLFAQARNGRVWSTSDFETWSVAGVDAPTKIRIAASRLPEQAARFEAVNGSQRAYALGRFVYRSDDAGRNWTPVTAYRNTSILGEGLLDIAASPRDARVSRLV